ncbi:hypothetical protein SUNI508_04670 [Seiridium unicorne]|uniref:Uncharacterized protein n=1 Tax=Seiridium unicorne TaxID=138068 RepID=A0ABR2V7X0_9PEZI
MSARRRPLVRASPPAHRANRKGKNTVDSPPHHHKRLSSPLSTPPSEVPLRQTGNSTHLDAVLPVASIGTGQPAATFLTVHIPSPGSIHPAGKFASSVVVIEEAGRKRTGKDGPTKRSRQPSNKGKQGRRWSPSSSCYQQQ